jgi:2-polyprenylphenol 6-hydroxylase
MTIYDVAIVGGGIVGAGLALALRDSGLTVGLIQNWHKTPTPLASEFDHRTYAITPGSVRFLESIGVWQALDAQRLAPIHSMHVWGDTGARLDFESEDLPELGRIIEHRHLSDVLQKKLREGGEVELIGAAPGSGLHWRDDDIVLRRNDGSDIAARLIVGADGADSWIRQAAGIEAGVQDYGEKGIVANFATALGHGNIARQWFRDDGVLAWLPLPGQAISIVWSTENENADRLLALAPELWAEEVRWAGGDALGELKTLSATESFPLRLLRVKELIRPRLALVGDAAHVIHPLAGQGLNLGLHDVRELAHTLRQRGPVRDCGDFALLRRYERSRKEDIAAMQWVTHSLRNLFRPTNPLLRTLRNRGMELTNAQGWLKRVLIHQASGL